MDPDTDPAREKKRNDAAEFGHLMHGWKETGRLKANKKYPGHIKTARNKLEKSGISRETYWPSKGPDAGIHEVTFAVNLMTKEVVWYRGKRHLADKWKEKQGQVGEHWLTGTIDWVVKRDGRLRLLGDLKTGKPKMDWDSYPPKQTGWWVDIDDNKQLLSYALPFWLTEGESLDWGVDTRLEHWPKYPLGGLPHLEYGRISGLEVRLHLVELLEALEYPVARPTEETCRFCDGKDNCTAFLMSGIVYKG